MTPLNSHLVLDALARTGAAPTQSGQAAPIRVVIAGGAAGLLSGLLRPARTTADCDVIWSQSEPAWLAVQRAAIAAAQQLSLPDTWLNRDCAAFAWCLPLAWRDRSVPVGTFGPLEVLRISRIDLIATKVVSSPRRPQDLEDLRDLLPTAAELAFVHEHLLRLAAEHPGREDFERQHLVLRPLGGAP